MKKLYHFLVTSYKLRITSYTRLLPLTSYLSPHTSYLIPLFAFCICNAFAQNNFPTSNAIWNYSVLADDWFSGMSGEKNIYYTICGNTTINDTVYYKLYTTLDTIMCGENLGEFKGYFRQDGSKVYFTPYSLSGPEFLLYDFGLSIGDTIVLNYGFYYRFWKNLNGHHYYDDHEFNDWQYKRLTVNNVGFENGIKVIYLDDDIWYEGIGSIFGLFHKGEQELNGYSFGFSLNCFKHNDTIKYLHNTDCNKCFCKDYIDVKDYIQDFSNMYIYPNPTSGKFKITNYELRMGCIEIFDIMGRRQKAEGRRQKTEDEMLINISHLLPGIYFLKIDNQTIKIIKN